MIVYEKEAGKHISKMDKPTKQRIKKTVEKLPAGDVKKLQGCPGEYLKNKRANGQNLLRKDENVECPY